MNRKLKFVYGIFIVLLLLANVASFWFGNLHSRQAMSVARVKVSELADAMQGDHFYSSYGDSALLFKAKVLSVSAQNGVAVVKFQTNRPYSVSCQFPAGS